MLAFKLRAAVVAQFLKNAIRKRRVLWPALAVLILAGIALSSILVVSAVSSTDTHAPTAAPVAHGSGVTGRGLPVTTLPRTQQTTPKAGAAAPSRPPTPQPSPSVKPKPSPVKSPALAPVVSQVHVVHAGDTLWTIAVQHRTTWQHIYQLNRDKITNPNLIYAGQILTL